MTTPPEPQPDPQELKQRLAGIFDRAADSYESSGVAYFDVVLDAGCGRGAATLPAAEAVGERGRVEAIDLAPAMVTLLGATAPPNVTAAVGDAEAPEFADGSFDAVLSAFVIFMLPDPLDALRRYRALLRPGGTVALSQFPEQPPSKWMQVGAVIGTYLDGPPPFRPGTSPVSSPEGLAGALRAAGFSDVRQETVDHEITFRDLDQWWSWVWSQGTRGMLEAIPSDRLAEAKAELYALIGADVPPGEPLTLTQRVTYTTAKS